MTVSHLLCIYERLITLNPWRNYELYPYWYQKNFLNIDPNLFFIYLIPLTFVNMPNKPKVILITEF